MISLTEAWHIKNLLLSLTDNFKNHIPKFGRPHSEKCVDFRQQTLYNGCVSAEYQIKPLEWKYFNLPKINEVRAAKAGAFTYVVSQNLCQKMYGNRILVNTTTESEQQAIMWAQMDWVNMVSEILNGYVGFDEEQVESKE